MRKFVGLDSGANAFSPCSIVHFNFSAVTRISPNAASTRVFPESRQQAVTISSWWSSTYLSSVQLALSHTGPNKVNRPQQRPKYPSPLRKTRPRPLNLRTCRSLNSPFNNFPRRRLNPTPQHSSVRRTITHNQILIPLPTGLTFKDLSLFTGDIVPTLACPVIIRADLGGERDVEGDGGFAVVGHVDCC